MELSPDCLSYDFRHKRRDIPAAFCDFLDQARTHIRIFRARHHEQCLAQIIQLAIHQRHLELIFKIGHGADAAQDGARFECGDRIDKESAERYDFNIVDSFACNRSSKVKSGFFSAFSATAIRTLSKMRLALRATSRCPFVTGSKLPG